MARPLRLPPTAFVEESAHVRPSPPTPEPDRGSSDYGDPVDRAMAEVAIPDSEQEAVIQALIDEPFVDLSGTAGVGKTFVARILAERHEGLVLTSTTGIAAVNLGEGQTINSLLDYYDTNSLRERFVEGRLQTKLRRLRSAGLRKILLDEKSMLDGHQLTFLVRAIDEVNKGKASIEDIGGEEFVDDDQPKLGLVLVGDFGQLPPVKAPFAFESAEWQRFAEHRVSLKTIRRQSDKDFIRALHDVRAGRVQDALCYFTENKFSGNMNDSFEGTTIFAKNDAVDRYNQLRLDALLGYAQSYTKHTWGKEAAEWKKIPYTVTFKDGALVMILANRRHCSQWDDDSDPEREGQLTYCNGDLATIVEMTENHVTCVLQRNHKTVNVRFVTRELKEPMELGRRKELIQAGLADKIKDKYEIVGTVTYMPLRLAYGSTVHKTQGLSLDRVQVNIRDHSFGSPQMMFVALSRARTPKGLRIVGSQRTFVSRISTNPAVTPWL